MINSDTHIMEYISDIAVKKRVLDIISKLTPNYHYDIDISRFKQGIQNKETWFSNTVALNWFTHNFFPKNYLEIGVHRGRSLAVVFAENPKMDIYGFDMWIRDYAEISNPGEEFVLNELRKFSVNNLPKLITGNSHDTLKAFFNNPNNPQLFDLITVDGDHTVYGAICDLDISINHLSPGGCLIFDDIRHHAHPELRELWDNKYKVVFKDWLFIDDESSVGTGLLFKPPFKRIKEFLI